MQTTTFFGAAHNGRQTACGQGNGTRRTGQSSSVKRPVGKAAEPQGGTRLLSVLMNGQRRKECHVRALISSML